jgi:hypothetical protein
VGATATADDAGAASSRRRSLPAWAPLALLFAAGALISGFTMLRGIDPFDEGLMLQAARRTADGQWVYRDFLWSYGPGNVVLLAGLFKAFGTSLLWWRVVRTAIDAAVALVVFLLVRREAGTRWALFGWVAAACAMAQPTSANPFPAALLFGLVAVGVAGGAFAGSGLGGRGWRVAGVAGTLTALAAFWRPDFGAYAALGCVVALLVRERGLVVRYVGSTGVASVLLYLPFAIAAGPGELLDSIVARSVRDGGYWGLPFPFAYDGPLAGARDAKNVLEFYVPLLMAIGLALAVGMALVALARRRMLSPTLAGLLAFGAGALLYLLSRTDEFHVTPLLVVLAAAIPLAAAAGRDLPRWLARAGVAVLALLALYGVSNRGSALVNPPSMAALDVPVADGVRARPVDARALPDVVRLVQQRVPPGQPIYVAPLRSDLVLINDPLLYVLTERPNATDEDFGLLTSAAAQRRIVAALERTRPGAIVRWHDPIQVKREPNRRGTPTGVHLLDAWIAREYRLLRRTGYYDVLVPRV